MVNASNMIAWKVSKYEVFSGPYFPAFVSPYLSVFSPNAGKHGPEKTSYLDTFHAVMIALPQTNFTCYQFNFFFSKKTTLLIKFASSFNRNRVKKAINVWKQPMRSMKKVFLVSIRAVRLTCVLILINISSEIFEHLSGNRGSSLSILRNFNCSKF